MKSYDVIVVGAGPAGLLAAGSAAQNGAKVLILEKMYAPGRKLLITGKGRCNVTNEATISEFITHIFPDGRFLRSAFAGFFSKCTCRRSAQRGDQAGRGRPCRMGRVAEHDALAHRARPGAVA